MSLFIFAGFNQLLARYLLPGSDQFTTEQKAFL